MCHLCDAQLRNERLRSWWMRLKDEAQQMLGTYTSTFVATAPSLGGDLVVTGLEVVQE